MDTTTRTRELATIAHAAMEVTRRDDGSTFWRVADGAPEWVTDLIRDAGHDGADILPDDYRYGLTEFALEIISEAEDEDEAQERADEWEPDVYTSALLQWLGSHVSRIGRADDAIEEGIARGVTDAAMWGQREEFREVFGAVLFWLTDMAEAAEEEDAA